MQNFRAKLYGDDNFKDDVYHRLVKETVSWFNIWCVQAKTGTANKQGICFRFNSSECEN